MPERKVEVGKAIGYGWESVKKNFWYFIGFVLLYMLASGLVSGISSALSRNSFALGSIGQLISVGVSILLTAGSLKIAISYYDGKKLPLGDLFSQSKYFWRILGSSILVGLICFVGFIFFIVPGIYFALSYQFTTKLIIDKDLEISKAMEESAKLTKGLKLPLLWLGIVEFFVAVLGFIVFGVGILVAIPVIWLADIYVYKNLLASSASSN